MPGHSWAPVYSPARYTFGHDRELRILSIIPPMTQLNTPYPSTAYLTGFLRSRGFKAEQADLSIALALKLLSVHGLQAIHARVSAFAQKTTHSDHGLFRGAFRVLSAPQSRRPFDFCKVVIPAWLIVSLRGITCPKARALLLSSTTSTTGDRKATRSTGPLVHWDCRIAPNTLPPFISMTSRTSSAMPSTRASSSYAMQNRWRRANRHSISCKRRSARRTIW